jgi:hypothetical protein
MEPCKIQGLRKNSSYLGIYRKEITFDKREG